MTNLITKDFPYGYIPTMAEINNRLKTHTCISTFSGVGGSSMGYKMSGFNVLAAVELQDYQAKNYRLNHPSTRMYETDIRKLDPLDILNDLGLDVGEVDVLDGSPPCTDFSVNGKRTDGWHKEKNYGNTTQRVDDLFHEYIRFVKVIQPKVFLAENVTGLIKGNLKGKFNEFFRAFKKLGYHVEACVLNSQHLGVAQSRERVFFQGVRPDIGKAPAWPDVSDQVFSVHNVIKDLKNDESPRYTLTQYMKTYWVNTRPGDSFEKARVVIQGKKGLFNHIRIDHNKPSPTIPSGFVVVYHQDHPRSLTINEVKRVSSFPDDFVLKGSMKKQWGAMGYCVPPLMISRIASAIRDQILTE